MLPTIIGIAVVVGLALGSLSLGKYITHQIQSIMKGDQELSEIEGKIEKLKRLGIQIDGKYLIVPKGYKVETGYTSKDNREAIKIVKGH